MCDLACRTKIIINGGNTANMLNELCYLVKDFPGDVDIPTGEALIKLLNKMEDDAGQAQRLFLEGVGFSGPWPKALS